MVHLVDLSQADAVVSVPEAMRAQLQSISFVRVISAANPEVMGNGEVIALSDMADDDSGVYELRARIDNSNHLFTGGMVVTVTSATGKIESAIRIPLGSCSLLTASLLTSCWSIRNRDGQTKERAAWQSQRKLGRDSRRVLRREIN